MTNSVTKVNNSINEAFISNLKKKTAKIKCKAFFTCPKCNQKVEFKRQDFGSLTISRSCNSCDWEEFGGNQK